MDCCNTPFANISTNCTKNLVFSFQALSMIVRACLDPRVFIGLFIRPRQIDSLMGVSSLETRPPGFTANWMLIWCLVAPSSSFRCDTQCLLRQLAAAVHFFDAPFVVILFNLTIYKIFHYNASQQYLQHTKCTYTTQC